MKKYAFLTISALLLFGIGACSDMNNVTNVPTPLEQEMTAGEIHTQFLEVLYADGDFAKMEKSSQVNSAAIAANEILIRYGLTPMSDEEINDQIQLGREMAQMNPIELIENVLNQEELIWWDRFSSEAKVDDARKVYKKHCELYGVPDEGSVLSNLLDIALSSAEFWGEYRADDIPTYQNPYVDNGQKSWRGVLRFVVAVVVDGGAGAASAAGGPVVSGVVGGLASAGADGMIFD